MGCCGSQAVDSAIVPLIGRCGRSMRGFLISSEARSAEIIAKGPLVPLMGEHGEIPRQCELPKTPLKVYDMNGEECEFYFQTDSIYFCPIGKDPEMIYYEEIGDMCLTRLTGYERQYMQMTFSTKFGFRTFYFVPIMYQEAIKHVKPYGS